MAGRRRRIARVGTLAVAVIVAAGCGSATPSAAPTSRPNLPNGAIDIGGGRRININCGGSGPVVILDGGLGNTSTVWTPVVRLVQGFATVCSYDRASLGGSDSRPLPHGAESAVDDLHALLSATKLPGPYVIVGASFGGLDIQIFARRYPSETAGVVLVDSLANGWDQQLESGILSPAQVAERRAIPNGEEISNEEIRSSEVAAGAGPAFPPVPLVVLRHGQPFPGGPDWPTDKVEALWSSLQGELAALSPRSTLLVAAQSGHRIHEQQADLVAAAIHAIVDPSRWPPTVPSLPPAFGAGASPVAAGAIRGSFVFSGTDGLHMAAADGAGSKVIVPDGDMLVGEPSVDASGRLLAYDRRPKPDPGAGPQGDPKSEIWVADITTGAAHRVAPDGQMPRLSPNGSWIAFERHGHTYLVKPDGTGQRDLGDGGCATWSPDSANLAMCTADDTVFVLAIADGRRTTLLTGPGLLDPTAWSPDGMRIALFGTQDGTGETYLVDADGTNLRRLTTAPGNQLADPWIEAGLIVTSSLPGADISDWFLVDPVSGAPSVIPWLRGVPNPIAYVVAP